MKKDTWILILAIGIFLLWKLTHLEFRFGDENVYFYMTHAIRGGLLPYRDFNLADPPAFIYLLTGFSTLIGKHFILFKVWPILFDTGNAVLIFLILRKIGNKFAVLGPALYFFSFTILSTSDYVTGAETAICFMLLAIYLDLRGKPALSGVSWALACLCKLYVAPALLAYLVYKASKREFNPILCTLIAGSIVGAIVLIPFFIAAPHQTLSNLVLYQLHRPAGLNKWNVFGLFFSMEWLLVLAGTVGIFVTKRKVLVWPLLASLVFLLWFKDLYYLYLHLLLPLLALLVAEFTTYLHEHNTDLAWGFVALYAFVSIYPIVSYTNTYAPQGIFEHPEEVAGALPNDRPVYGVQEAAPLVALIADKPIFQNVIDTNTQNFESGALSKQDVSDDAVKHGIYLISRIADYPDQGVTDTGFDGYFTQSAFKNCRKISEFPRPVPDEVLNALAIYRCP